MSIYFEQTSIGMIGISEKDGAISNLYFQNELPKEKSTAPTSVIRTAFAELAAYLSGELQDFSVPLNPEGSQFFRQVWDVICKVTYGETKTYKEVAITIGHPKACRAIGLAAHSVPIPIFIPCHRIIGSNGNLTGYRGGVPIKSTLLRIEKENRNAREILK